MNYTVSYDGTGQWRKHLQRKYSRFDPWHSIMWHHHHHNSVRGRAHRAFPLWHALEEHSSSVRRRKTLLLKPVYLCSSYAFNHGRVALPVLHWGIRRLQLHSYGRFPAHFIRELVFRVDECRWWGLYSLLAQLCCYSALIMHINEHRLYIFL